MSPKEIIDLDTLNKHSFCEVMASSLEKRDKRARLKTGPVGVAGRRSRADIPREDKETVNSGERYRMHQYWMSCEVVAVWEELRERRMKEKGEAYTLAVILFLSQPSDAETARTR